MKCICCKKNVRTTRDERDAFYACGYYTPEWWVRDQAVDPDRLARHGVDANNSEDFLCFDCAHTINCEGRESRNSLLSPVSEATKGKHIKEGRYMNFIDYSWSRKLDSVAVIEFRDFCEKNAGVNTDVETMGSREWDKLLRAWSVNIGEKLKEGRNMRGNGGWPYDENDIVWNDNDKILVNLRMDAYPAAVQDAVMSPATAFDADGYPALSPEIEAEMLSFDTDVDNKVKAHGGYEFVYDGDGESGMTAPQYTGMWCMTYGEFQEMLQQEGLPESWFDVQLKANWY